MKLSIIQGQKAILLCYGCGGAMLLAAALGGAIQGDETAKQIPAGRSELADFITLDGEAASRQAQEALASAKLRLQKQEGLTDTARHVRLTALEDSTAIYVSMMDRLGEIRLRDPELDSPEAKTLVRSASAVVARLEEPDDCASGDTIRPNMAMKGLAVLGLLSLFAGAAQSFPISRSVLKPLRALAGLIAAARAT